MPQDVRCCTKACARCVGENNVKRLGLVVLVHHLQRHEHGALFVLMLEEVSNLLELRKNVISRQRGCRDGKGVGDNFRRGISVDNLRFDIVGYAVG